jgi:hypothetical protein
MASVALFILMAIALLSWMVFIVMVFILIFDSSWPDNYSNQETAKKSLYIGLISTIWFLLYANDSFWQTLN